MRIAHELIGIAVGAAVGILVVVLVAWLWLRGRGSSVMRARRNAAILAGPISAATPFEITGVARADRLQLHLDMEVHVLGGADVEVSFRSCGVRLSYEVLANDARLAGGDVKLPADHTKLGADVHATDTMFPSPRTRVRCTVAVGDAMSFHSGARVTLRGTATMLPENEVKTLALWIG